MIRKLDLPYTMRSGGRLYFRRGKGSLVRLPEPTEPGFLAAYEAALRGKPPAPKTTTVAALVDSYGRSTRWDRLAPRTRSDYRKVMEYLRAKIGDRDVSEITRPLILEAMEANRHRARFANYIAQIASVLCEHAVDLGWRRDNPVKGVRLLKPENKAPHIPWPDWAVAKFRAEAGGTELLIFEMGVGSVQRPADLTRFRWSDYDGTALRVTQSKTGTELHLPCTPQLKAALDAAPRRSLTILSGRDGRPLPYAKMARLMLKERERLSVAEYDLHALRYRGVMELAWAGCTDDEIASFSGHSSKDMVRKYAGKARQIMRARQANAKRG